MSPPPGFIRHYKLRRTGTRRGTFRRRAPEEPPGLNMTASAPNLDPFICGKLEEWGLKEYKGVFADNKITRESFSLLTEQDISDLIKDIGPRAIFREGLKNFKKEEEGAEGGSAQPSTSGTSNGGKRKTKPQDPTLPRTKKQKRRDLEGKLEKVKNIMTAVSEKLPDEEDDFIHFLWEKITGLSPERRELVGVFGRTGAGKSSLINAVIEENNLLPTGIGKACTSVIIKVEANTENNKYVAVVEFISMEDFDELLWSSSGLVDSPDKKKNDDDDSKDITEKMTALFGDQWKIPPDEFKKSVKCKEISKLIKMKTHSMSHESPNELSEQLKSFTKNIKDKEKIWYWPVVKCVTIKVPNNELLRRVTLVDLPGTGDCNKSRNHMWKEMVSSCGTVWVVTEVTRAASEKEAWDILESACRHLGNGGECHDIHFICTKSDTLKDHSPQELKGDVYSKFMELSVVQNQFPENCLKVFIVSTDEEKEMPAEQNEISVLEEFLEKLNDQQEHVQSYVTAAYSILALMKGARSVNVQKKTEVYEKLCVRRNKELSEIREKMETVHKDFEQSLTEGVNKAKAECLTVLEALITSKIKSSFRKFERVVKKDGEHTTGEGEQINLNMTLSSFLTDTIDSKFREAFPNSGKFGRFFGGVHVVSDSNRELRENVFEVGLLLDFLMNEEGKLNLKLCKEIRKRKKQIYRSFTETVKEMMEDGYKAAKKKRTLKEMNKVVLTHVQEKKDVMFDEAKRNMLEKLQRLMNDIQQTIKEDLEKALTLSLKKDVEFLPDIEDEFLAVKKHINED